MALFPRAVDRVIVVEIDVRGNGPVPTLLDRWTWRVNVRVPSASRVTKSTLPRPEKMVCIRPSPITQPKSKLGHLQCFRYSKISSNSRAKHETHFESQPMRNANMRHHGETTQTFALVVVGPWRDEELPALPAGPRRRGRRRQAQPRQEAASVASSR